MASDVCLTMAASRWGPSNPPIELPAKYEVVRDRMLSEIELRFGG